MSHVLHLVILKQKLALSSSFYADEKSEGQIAHVGVGAPIASKY